jgi:hypothetical protein
MINSSLSGERTMAIVMKTSSHPNQFLIDILVYSLVDTHTVAMKSHMPLTM